MKQAKRFTCVALFFSTLVFLSTPSLAATIPITGSANWSGSVSYQFEFAGSGSGHSLSAYSATADAQSELWCAPNQACSLFLPAGDQYGFSWPGGSMGQLDGVSADVLGNRK